MAKITIELTENSNTIVTYDNGKTVYPICNVDDKGFHINNATNTDLLTLIAMTIRHCGQSLEYQLSKQRLAFNSVFKLSDNK